jgi:hypothetical protein
MSRNIWAMLDCGHAEVWNDFAVAGDLEPQEDPEWAGPSKLKEWCRLCHMDRKILFMAANIWPHRGLARVPLWPTNEMSRDCFRCAQIPTVDFSKP